jgi:hypothetical protein
VRERPSLGVYTGVPNQVRAEMSPNIPVAFNRIDCDRPRGPFVGFVEVFGTRASPPSIGNLYPIPYLESGCALGGRRGSDGPDGADGSDGSDGSLVRGIGTDMSEINEMSRGRSRMRKLGE